jgi:hypothetical protein
MAVLTSLVYARSTLKSPKTGQRVRLSATVGNAVASVYNKTRPGFGFYGRAGCVAGRCSFDFSSYGAPPLLLEGLIAENYTEPAFDWDSRGWILLLASDLATIVERTSDDGGLTWNAPVARFTGSHAEICRAPMGLILRAAYVAGALKINRQELGDANPGADFSAVDGAATPLALQDDTFRLAVDPRGWWMLHARISGGTTTLLYSTDAGYSWSVTSGAVTGLASGTHPGIATAPDGSMLAWAYLAGELHISRRASGDTAWSAFSAAKDTALVNLSLADAPFSIAAGIERPGRWIGVWSATGSTTPAEYWSRDAGATWAVFS